ncbi:MAG TPA: ABC transporter ATP-binding protein [Candidatus Eisenbacteria bacterium]|nr:ABC transporter ATP-binding protein [Candidatus Eisenbacteria bacterium]
MNPSIEIRNLVRRYGDVEAVRELTLDIRGGEIFGLLGPNGAGKSTTLRVLATLLRPTAGSVRVAGHDVVAEADEVRRRIGYVPEGADLYDALTGAEFLELLADLHRLDRDAAIAKTGPLLDTFALTPDIGRPVGDYSKGMKQKLLIAAALQHDPDVLLLDEPLDGLDVAAQETLKGVLHAHAAAGRVVVYSSHILEVVERLCHRVGIIDRGRLVALGAPADLLAAHPGRTLSELFLQLTAADARA